MRPIEAQLCPNCRAPIGERAALAYARTPLEGLDAPLTFHDVPIRWLSWART